MLIVKGIRKLPKMPRGFPTVLVPGNGKGKCMLVVKVHVHIGGINLCSSTSVQAVSMLNASIVTCKNCAKALAKINK